MMSPYFGRKLNNKKNKARPNPCLDEIKHGPAIQQAHEIQKNAAQIGFDFPDVEGAYGKLNEELAELQQAMHNQKFRRNIR